MTNRYINFRLQFNLQHKIHLWFSTQADWEINLFKGCPESAATEETSFNYFIKLVPLQWRFIAFCSAGIVKECGHKCGEQFECRLTKLNFHLSNLIFSRIAEIYGRVDGECMVSSLMNFYDVVNQLFKKSSLNILTARFTLLSFSSEEKFVKLYIKKTFN